MLIKDNIFFTNEDFYQTDLKNIEMIISSNNCKQVLVKTRSYFPEMDKQGFHRGFSNKHLVGKSVKVSLKEYLNK